MNVLYWNETDYMSRGCKHEHLHGPHELRLQVDEGPTDLHLIISHKHTYSASDHSMISFLQPDHKQQQTRMRELYYWSWDPSSKTAHKNCKGNQRKSCKWDSEGVIFAEIKPFSSCGWTTTCMVVTAPGISHNGLLHSPTVLLFSNILPALINLMSFTVCGPSSFSVQNKKCLNVLHINNSIIKKHRDWSKFRHDYQLKFWSNASIK